MIEDLASVLGAATACSKPVSDLGWRPHGEHVGQTGKPVATTNRHRNIRSYPAYCRNKLFKNKSSYQ
jgi:hypothetical protein